MKKLITLTKTLLVLAGLCVGVNAWADATVGNADNTSAFFTEFSDYYTIAPNGTLTVSFTNYSSKSYNAANWIAAVTTDADRADGAQSTDAYYEYAILRADNMAWRAGDYAGTNTFDGTDNSWATIASNYNWDNFASDMDGSNVIMKVSRNGATVTILATITTTNGNIYTESLVFNSTSAEETLRFFLSVDNSHIEDLTKDVAMYDFEDGNAVFTRRSRVTVAIEDNTALKSKVVGFTCASNAQNGYSFADYNMTALTSEAQIVNIAFDYYNTDGGRCFLTIGDASMRGTTGGSSKTTYNPIGGIFRIGSDKNDFYINSTNLTKATYCNKWLNVNVEVDVTNKEVSYTVKEKEGGTVLQTGKDIDFYADGASCTQIDLFGYINSSHMAMIDNLTIVGHKDETATYADYTVSFYDQTSETEIKSELRNGLVGSVISLTNSDVSDFKNDDNTIKYIYVSDDSEGKTVTNEGTTVTITFRQADKYNYTVTAIDADENIISAIVEDGINFEGDHLVVHCPKYIADGGDLYFIGEDPEATSPTTKIEKDLSADDAINVRYSIAAMGEYYMFELNGNYATRADYESSGSAATGSATVTVPQKGLYIITANCYGSATNRTANIKVGETTIVDNTEITIYAPGTNLVSTETLLYEDDIIKVTTSDSKSGIDYVILQRTGNAPSVTIGAAGYATFSCSDKALDFTNTDVKAYTASLNSDNTVLLTPATQVPANTGLVLAGAQGTYDIPVIASAEVITGNLLKPSSADEVIAASTDALHHYVLAKRNDNVGFYNLATAKNIGAGKAYLETTVALATNADSRVAWIFADGTTGIKTTNLTNDTNETIYNLNGQRVAAPQKGLYIVNGKKVIMK